MVQAVKRAKVCVAAWYCSQLVWETGAKMCLLHERVVQQKRNFLGRPYLANVTLVKIHNCPVYTRCCDASSGCCFDYPWFWSSFAIVIFTLLLAGLLSVYYWYKRKREAAIHSAGCGGNTIPTSDPSNGLAFPLNPYWRTGHTAEQWTGPCGALTGPKPPAYSPCQDCTAPPSYQSLADPPHPPAYRPSCSMACVQARPGRAWSRSFGEAPPPYFIVPAPAAVAAGGGGAGGCAGDADAGCCAGGAAGESGEQGTSRKTSTIQTTTV
ncbi:uncharacterized protein [Littorina saxatilis]|uniref:Uncharacterized protein n=1 Tax=Littorina saxatilis TaxID=31220 RepID=A0AAN9BFQ9_9CAEN